MKLTPWATAQFALCSRPRRSAVASPTETVKAHIGDCCRGHHSTTRIPPFPIPNTLASRSQAHTFSPVNIRKLLVASGITSLLVTPACTSYMRQGRSTYPLPTLVPWYHTMFPAVAQFAR